MIGSCRCFVQVYSLHVRSALFFLKSKYLNSKRSPFQDFLARHLCVTGMSPGVVIYFYLLLVTGTWRSSQASAEPFFAHMATCVGEPIIAVKVPERERTALAAWNNLFSSGIRVQPGHGSSFFHLFDKARKIATSTPILRRRWKRCLKAVCVPNTDLQSISCRTLYYSYNPFRHACVPQKGFCERTKNHFATISDCQLVCSPGHSRVATARSVRHGDTRIQLRVQRDNDGVTTTLVNSTLKVPREKSLLFIGYILPEPSRAQTGVAESRKTSQGSTSKHPNITHSVAPSKPATQPSYGMADGKFNPSMMPQGQREIMPQFSSRPSPALGPSSPVTDSFGKYEITYRNQMPSWPTERASPVLLGSSGMQLPHFQTPGLNRIIQDSRTPDIQLPNEANEGTIGRMAPQRTREDAIASYAKIHGIPVLQSLSSRDVGPEQKTELHSVNQTRVLQSVDGVRPLVGPKIPVPANTRKEMSAKKSPSKAVAQSPAPRATLQRRIGSSDSLLKNPPLGAQKSGSTKGASPSPVEQTTKASATTTPAEKLETPVPSARKLQRSEERADLARDTPSSPTDTQRSSQAALGPPLWAFPLMRQILNPAQGYPKGAAPREPVVEERIVAKTAPQTGMRTLYSMRGRYGEPSITANRRDEGPVARAASWRRPQRPALRPPISPGYGPAPRF